MPIVLPYIAMEVIMLEKYISLLGFIFNCISQNYRNRRHCTYWGARENSDENLVMIV